VTTYETCEHFTAEELEAEDAECFPCTVRPRSFDPDYLDPDDVETDAEWRERLGIPPLDSPVWWGGSAEASEGACLYCHEPLPGDAHHLRRYCSDAHRKAHSRRRAKRRVRESANLREGSQFSRSLPPGTCVKDSEGTPTPL
jgi:hypothetical protein